MTYLNHTICMTWRNIVWKLLLKPLRLFLINSNHISKGTSHNRIFRSGNMWNRIFVSCSGLYSYHVKVKIWPTAQNTRKTGSPGNVSLLLRDSSCVVLSFQVVLERLEILLFIINTLYQGLERDKTEYPVIVRATVRISRDWSLYKWLQWRRSCRLGGMNSTTITEVFFSSSKWKHTDWAEKQTVCTEVF